MEVTYAQLIPKLSAATREREDSYDAGYKRCTVMLELFEWSKAMYTLKPIRTLTKEELYLQIGTPSTNPEFACPSVGELGTEPCGMRLVYYPQIHGGPVCPSCLTVFKPVYSSGVKANG